MNSSPTIFNLSLSPANSKALAERPYCFVSKHLLPKLNIKIDSLFLVGPFIDYFRWRSDYYEEFDSFQAKPYLWNIIKKLANHIEVFQSTNDVIPVAEGQLIANSLDAQIHIVKNAGHFNTYTYKRFVKFPLLLKNIKKHLNI